MTALLLLLVIDAFATGEWVRPLEESFFEPAPVEAPVDLNQGGWILPFESEEPRPKPTPKHISPAPRGNPMPRLVAESSARRGSCPSDMVAVGGFCIDRYEAPNIQGAKPFAAQKAQEGEDWCAARGKRLCSESEWEEACMGASKNSFPYGKSYKPGGCHDQGGWSVPDWNLLQTIPSKRGIEHAAALYRAEASGSRASCVSEDGVADMAGNVAEWTRRTYHSSAGFSHVMRGGFWHGGWGKNRTPGCTTRNSAHPGHFRSYETGFRCCQ